MAAQSGRIISLMRKKRFPRLEPVIAAALLAIALPAQADPLLSSWYTANSTKYARIYTSAANRTSGISTATWTGQTSPTYAGVHEIDYSANWVYIRNSGLGGHVMGPWNNPNLPKNQSTATSVYRFPRTVTIPGSKTLTGLGTLGFLVDGVAIFDTRDAFSYKTSSSTDASPMNGLTGDGIWNRDAWANEAVSFDAAYAHQPGNGQYHCHANPLAIRYLLGDNVNYDSATKLYSENTSTTTFKHSPLLGWLADGIPLYGPYAYDGGSTGATAEAGISGGVVSGVTVLTGGTLYQSVPLVTFSGGGGSGASATAVVTGGVVTGVTLVSGGTGYTSAPTVTIGGVRRMISGYVQRDGTNGTTSYGTGNRQTLPAWAALAQSRSATLSSGQYGPPVNTTYPLGHYIEDYDYLGDLGYTQGSRSNAGGVFFDLNKYNARYCVTPEFPNGTWAYFVSIKADGTPWYPYNVGRWFYGSVTGGTSTTTVMNADTPLTQYYKGGPSTAERWVSAPLGLSGSNVTLSWNAVEGGTYQVSASNDMINWTALSPTVTATGGSSASMTETGGASSSTNRFYKLTRTALATYDSTGY